jgi:hypothetical protein
VIFHGTFAYRLFEVCTAVIGPIFCYCSLKNDIPTALNRALSSGLFAEDTKSSVIDAIGTRLEDSNIDVRREAAKLFGGLLTSETVHNAVIGLLSRLAKVCINIRLYLIGHSYSNCNSIQG